MRKDIRIKSREVFLKSLLKISIVLFISLFIFINLNFKSEFNQNYTLSVDKNVYIEDEIMTPENSGDYDGILNLTNHNEIDGRTFYRGTNITIKGLIYYPIPYSPLINVNVSIVVDNTLYTDFSNKTDVNGKFQIIYNVSYSLDINRTHIIQVNVIDNLNILYNHQYSIYANATSYFDINNWSPEIPGEDYVIPGYLNFDNHSGIPNQQIFSSWLNKSVKITDNPPFSTNSIGSFPLPLTIPNDNYSDVLYLNFTYSGNTPYINGSKTEIAVRLFRNITCIWNTASSATEGAQIVIRGQILDSNNTKIEINNRLVNIYYDNQPEGTATTNENGYFQFTFNIPSGLGNKPIYVEVINSLGLNIRSNATYIRITGAIVSETSSPSGKSGTKDPPFFNFFLVLIPIVIGGIAAFAIYAYFYLRKQEEESRLVKVPLEGRIRNLKILKDTGRLEESLSYLFQSIYLELINAKYGRIKRPTETIRDFAIISVKDLNINPANIYPFIQNIERIIYDKPFIIEEKDFYSAVELFSPIYFELTGYQFVLNF